MTTADPFPRERFGALVRRLPRYARLSWSLGRHPKVTTKRRMALIGAAVYVVSPIDLVPGFIPVAGQLDDAAAVLIAIGIALRSMQPADRAVVLAAAGLEASDIDEDLRTIRACYAWMGRRGLRLGKRAVSGVARAGGRALVAVGSRLRRARSDESPV